MSRVPLFHKIYGEGEPLIVLHGLFGMSDNWATFAKKMAQHRMVILVDIRDHGRSPHTNEFNYELVAEDIAGLMEDNWVHHADIIGHSMGGKAAIQLTHMHPDLVRRLAVIDIGPGKNPDRHDSIFNALASIEINTVVSRKEVEATLSSYIQDIAVLRFIMKNLAREKKGGFRWKMNFPLLKDRFEDILAPVIIEKIVTPTIFVKGEYSDYLDEYQLKIIKEHFENYSFQEIQGAGHWVHADKPDDFFQTIFDFLN